MKLLCLLTLFGAALLPAATTYSVVNLGSLGGSSSVAYHINDAGVVVGWSQTTLNDSHAFSSTGSSPQDLNQAAASNSFAYGNNGSGQIVGTSYINGQTHGTMWSTSGVSDLGAGTSAMSINASGQVAGGNGDAFVYDNGKFTDLGTLPGGNWSAAYGINDNGMVAGYGATTNGFRAFTWTAGSGLSILGTLGGNSSYAMGINNQGQVAGNSIAADGYAHAFL
ncbi:MAG: HAF repeat-containing protein, partial [Acidobacteriota bacterium]|nr:HAF repeat-containing protein [Acidobacteriota bacterium]